MFMRILTFTAAMYGELGPGLILAASLPFSLISLALVAREVARRVMAERRRSVAG